MQLLASDNLVLPETAASPPSPAPTYHQQAVVAQGAAGDGGEVVVVAQDAAAVALPAPLPPQQAEVPGGGGGVGAVGQPPQGDVDRSPQDAQGRPLWWTSAGFTSVLRLRERVPYFSD